MSASDSRKSFLAKLTLCGVAVLAAPGLVWRRIGAGRFSEPVASEGGAVAAPISLKPDQRAVARETL
ncbi:MAG: hypothetical protein QM691_04455 [Opitutaceae bacterium]